MSRGLCVHQMIGIDPDKVIATFAPGPDIKPLTARLSFVSGAIQGIQDT